MNQNIIKYHRVNQNNYKNLGIPNYNAINIAEEINNNNAILEGIIPKTYYKFIKINFVKYHKFFSIR